MFPEKKAFGISDLSTEALETQWTQKLPGLVSTQNISLSNKGEV